MSESAVHPRGPSVGTALAWARGNLPFLSAVALVSVTAALALANWTEKEPIPWPEGVKVTEEFRMLSLPSRFGPYVLVSEGDIARKFEVKSDGGIEVSEDVLRDLKIGTILDRERRGNRRSNWYAIQVYRDARTEDKALQGCWYLEVYYYTGVRDNVPHVPERCLVAGGAKGLRSGDVPLPTGAAGSVWPGEVNFRRVTYQREGRGQGISYYTFSLNGRPESEWTAVRKGLAWPWVRYCYFAKIQFSPVGAVGDLKEADERARDFATYCLPEVLKLLPMPADIEKLIAAEKRGAGA